MLKKRIIPVITTRGGMAVKGKQYQSWRTVGQLRNAIRVYQQRGVDELMLLDIGATEKRKAPRCDDIREFAGECFMPVTVGGGIWSTEHIRQLLASGADKVVLGSSAIERPQLVEAAAKKFGSQAVTVSIDVKFGEVYSRCGTVNEHLDPVFFAIEMESRGAGEILFNSIDREGTLSGYDTALIHELSCHLTIPLVANGGAGSYQHMAEALAAGADAVAAGAMFQFTDATPAGAADYLIEKGFAVRPTVYAEAL